MPNRETKSDDLTGNKIEFFLSDVDGSLTNPDHQVTDRARRALGLLRKQKIQFSIVSGRPPLGLRKLISELDLTLPLAAFDGGMVIRPDLSVIEEHRLDARTAAAVIETLQAEGVDVWLYRGTEWFIKGRASAHVSHEISNVGFEPIQVRELDPGQGAVKIVAVSDDLNLMARCEKSVRSTFSNQVSAELSQPYYLDITHPKANKGEVVRSLSRLLSIPMDRFATLGDMANDISMFKVSGISIAMGNASLDVSGAADYETQRNDDEGFAYAVESIILPLLRRSSDLLRSA
jgi:Cof subfamily protein (haloacid dehalogenase superfamily)